MRPIRVTHEQSAFHEDMKAFLKSIYAGNEALRGEPIVIAQARSLLHRAVALELPQIMLVEMQMLISSYENEGRLPPHLRASWYKGGDTPVPTADA